MIHLPLPVSILPGSKAACLFVSVSGKMWPVAPQHGRLAGHATIGNVLPWKYLCLKTIIYRKESTDCRKAQSQSSAHPPHRPSSSPLPAHGQGCKRTIFPPRENIQPCTLPGWRAGPEREGLADRRVEGVGTAGVVLLRMFGGCSEV